MDHSSLRYLTGRLWRIPRTARVAPLLCVVLLNGGAPAAAASDPTARKVRALLGEAPQTGYRIDAIRVGYSPAVKRKLFITDPTMAERIPIAFAFWLLRGAGRTILVDAGFIDEKMKRLWGVREHREPDRALADLGVSPEQVTDIIITHQHWDHIGGIVRFPGADLWIARGEFARALRQYAGRDPALAAALQRAERAGKVHRTQAMQKILPSLVVVRQGLHTQGFQYVVVHNPEGIWVLASDIGPLRRNFERVRPTGLTHDSKRARAALVTIRALVADNLDRIVPGHEPALFARASTVRLTPATSP